MKEFYFILILLMLCNFCRSQSNIKERFPFTSVDAQFAGSIGLYSIGLFKISKREKVEVGILLGHLPKNFGGPVQAITLKFRYNPFTLALTKKLSFQPIQTGIFVSQSFSENLTFNWSSKYPKGYYWWNSSLRHHPFFSTQISYSFNDYRIEKISIYAEANTNDLYMYSFFSNTKTIKIYDILFLGIGTKLYF